MKSSGNEPVLDSGPAGRRAMTEVVAAAGVIFSVSIFVAHAFDAYRTRWAANCIICSVNRPVRAAA